MCFCQYKNKNMKGKGNSKYEITLTKSPVCQNLYMFVRLLLNSTQTCLFLLHELLMQTLSEEDNIRALLCLFFTSCTRSIRNCGLVLPKNKDLMKQRFSWSFPGRGIEVFRRVQVWMKNHQIQLRLRSEPPCKPLELDQEV